MDDSLLEDNENVTITLDTITSGDPSIGIGVINTATAVIADDDSATVSIVASDNAAAEPSNDGQFTVQISALSDTDTVVSYTVSGDATDGQDFASLSGTVTILAGQSTATIDVDVLDDSLLEDNETVTVTLDSIASGDSDISIGTTDTATVTIADNDSAQVSITAVDASAAEPGDSGQFSVTLNNPSDTDTVVAYTVSGTADSGDDYIALSGTVTIAAGTTEALIDVNVLDDVLLEGSESVTVSLDSISSGDTDISIGSANNATVFIADNDLAEVNVQATTNASEPASNGQFTVTLSTPSNTDTIVSYTVAGDATAGTDYVALSGSVTILAGQTSAIVDVTTLDDTILEDSENVVLTLDSITAGDSEITIGLNNEATVTIADDDSAQVSIFAVDPDAEEPSDNGQFTVSLSGVSDTDTVIRYDVSGDATEGTDYATLAGTVTILAGQTTATIDLNVIDDSLLEDIETATVTLAEITSGDADITIGSTDSATVSIADNDTAEVTIVANDFEAQEPNNDGQFTVSISNPSDTRHRRCLHGQRRCHRRQRLPNT